MKKVQFEEITKAKVSENKNIVISKKSTGGFAIAQQLVVSDGTNQIPLFLKGAIGIDDVEGLKKLRDALDYVIGLYE